MKIKNPKTEVPYWDEGQVKEYRWYQKGFWKRYLRKKFIRNQLKNNADLKCNLYL